MQLHKMFISVLFIVVKRRKAGPCPAARDQLRGFREVPLMRHNVILTHAHVWTGPEGVVCARAPARSTPGCTTAPCPCMSRQRPPRAESGPVVARALWK